MVGAEPVIWIANEGEAVTETADITESTSTEVFVQFTVTFFSGVSQGNGRGESSQTHGYTVDLALYHHGGVLAAIQTNDLVDLAIVYRKTWFILLILLECCRQD